MAEYKSRPTQQRAPRPDYGEHHRRNKNDFGGSERLRREEAVENDSNGKTYEQRQNRHQRRHQPKHEHNVDHFNQPPRSYREYKPVRKNHQVGDEDHKGGNRYPDVKEQNNHRRKETGRRYIPESSQPSERDIKLENARKYERKERYHKEHLNNVVEKRFAKREYTDKLQDEGKLPRKFEYSHKMNPSLDRRMNSFEHRLRKERQPKGGPGRYGFGEEKSEVVKEQGFTQKMVSLSLNEPAVSANENKKNNFTKLANEHKEKVETSTKQSNYRSLEEYLAEE